MQVLRGRVHRYGKNVDTDVIIPARYLVTSDPDALKPHCMEDIDPDFVGRVRPGDMIVADTNYGCGSSREHAPIAIKANGVSCIVAKSFGRIFFRNSINQGLPVLECPEAVDATQAGDELEVDLGTGNITNLTRRQTFKAAPFEPFVLELLQAGGLIPYTQRKLRQRGVASS
ncbi:MAG: 3-isopropylmalate dehydratase small subunit [Chloroflexi bacterium]|nr:3-isopropylmalate dehydratase small subunit [Chloroflexota bacterium]